ncbi:MAG: aminotransferase class IV [Chitinophagaceae bacterium]
MYPFFESIKADSEHGVHNVQKHIDRLEKTCQTVWQQSPSYLQELRTEIERIQVDSVHKIRLQYNIQQYKISTTPYTPKDIKSIVVVEDNDIDYALKYSNRHCFDKHLKLLEPNSELIIVQEGRITDSSFSNLIFFDQEKWVTPQKPLLYGIQRDNILLQNLAKPKDIFVDELNTFSHIMFVNAMLAWSQMIIKNPFFYGNVL